MSILTPVLDSAPSEPLGPARITHWSSKARLDQLGTYEMVFDTTGESDPWTLLYEESIYVIDGDAWLVDIDAEQQRTTRLTPGGLAVITRGSTVRYGGAADTRLLLSIAPVNWQPDESVGEGT